MEQRADGWRCSSDQPQTSIPLYSGNGVLDFEVGDSLESQISKLLLVPGERLK
jgi:hypothetical protein